LEAVVKILGSEVYMAASHRLLQHEEVRQSVRLWTGAQSPAFGPDAARLPVIDRVTISDAARAAQAADPSAAVADGDPAENDPRFVLLRAIIRLLTGEEARVFDARELRAPATAAPPVAARPAANGSAADSPGRGVEYDLQSAHAEVEQLELAARGVVRTADGREISFALDISLSRTYYEESNLRLRLGDGARPRKDPLLVNFAGTSAQLVGQRFRFDLDVDGKAENVNLPAAGTGFLVLDSNGDQRINDGSELFGALSGDGFADLEPLDDDGNGWIDENDAAYSQLRLWMPDADGGGPLLTLQQADVGALGLARVATPFDLRDGANETLAQLRSSGIYLRDSGGAGSLQQVDLSV
jgi:hypothetical protein